MMRTTVLLVLLAAGVASGCLGGHSRLDANWGTSQRDLVSAQTRNPAGVGPEIDPGQDMDGTTVETAIDKFRRGQTGRSSPPGSVINIGTVGQ